MSQEQRQRPQDQVSQQPIRYGDVFNVGGDLATKPVTPQDAATMQAAEATAFGATPTGGPGDVMQSAATVNAQTGLVSPDDVTDAARAQGVTITGIDAPGGRIITESVGGQVVGHYVQAAAPDPTARGQERTTTEAEEQGKVTIGQALEATIKTVGDKAVEQSDAAAISEAEMRATGSTVLAPGGYAARARSAAAYNMKVVRDKDKVKIKDVVGGAGAALPSKAVTREDAEAVTRVEQRNNPFLTAHPGGVATSMATAARLNEEIDTR